MKTLEDLFSEANGQMELIREEIRDPKVSDKKKSVLLVRFRDIAEDLTDKVNQMVDEVEREVQEHWFITWEELVSACHRHSCESKTMFTTDDPDESIGFYCLGCGHKFSIKLSDFKRINKEVLKGILSAKKRQKLAESFSGEMDK